MNTVAVPQVREFKSRGQKLSVRFGDWRSTVISVLVGIGYYAGAKLGFALTFQPHPVSVMWLPNSILLAGFLLSPVRIWGLILLTVLPAHLAVELGGGVPWSMVLCWFISNSFEALIGAVAIRLLSKGPVRFDSFRNIGTFFFWGALMAPFLSSFIDAGFVILNRWGTQGYWQIWRLRFFSNVCASTILVPAIIAWCTSGSVSLRNVSIPRVIESLLLALGFLITSAWVFSWKEAGADYLQPLLYAPLPFLLWASMRFGLRATTSAIFAVAILAIWGATHGRGPFPTKSADYNALSIQGFLLGFGVTLNLFAASMTEQKAAAAALKSNEERYREVVDSQAELVCRCLPDTTLTFVNHAYCQVFGRSREQLIGRKFLQLLRPSAYEPVLNQITKLVETEQSITYENEVCLPDGRVGWQHWTAHAIKDCNGRVQEIQAIGRDITERKKVETALRESEERNRAILEAIPDFMFLMSESGVYLDYYAADENVLLVSPKLFLNRSVWDVLPAQLAGDVMCGLDSVVQTGEMKVLEYELEIAGQRRWFEARLVRCGADKILSLVRDITTRKEDQTALTLSEERYREVVESQTDLVSRFLPDTTVTFVNKACCGFFEKKREELIGRKLLELLPPGLHAKIVLDITTIVSEKRPVTCEHSLNRSDGTTGWYQWTKYGIADSDGNITEIQAIGRDITDRKRAEEAGEKLIHASRLAVVGELTAMIAHEVNQPLNAILNNSEVAETLFSRTSVPLEEIRNVLADIHSDGIRACKAIARIRDLVQRRKMQMQSVEINGLIKDVVRIVSADAQRRHVQIRMEFSSSLPTVRADPVRIQQVLLNLILNAMDAMHSVAEARRVLTLQTQQNERCLIVTVKDSGHGMSPDVLPRMFESFFSTKADGMGLGLSVARSIIDDHHGRIWAEANVPTGASIHFALPVSDGRPDTQTIKSVVQPIGQTENRPSS
jgi:PAS domain S-box-containing protein